MRLFLPGSSFGLGMAFPAIYENAYQSYYSSAAYDAPDPLSAIDAGNRSADDRRQTDDQPEHLSRSGFRPVGSRICYLCSECLIFHLPAMVRLLPSHGHNTIRESRLNVLEALEYLGWG